MDVSANKHIAVTVARRHRVVVEPVAHQRQRGDLRRDLLASVVRRRRQGPPKRGKIALQPLADRPIMAAQTVPHSTRQHSSRWAFNASKLSNTGIGTR